MAKGIPSFYGARLSQARAARGLTGVTLADLSGVTPSTISQYEHDAAKPTSEMHEKLATVLNMPKSFFLQAPAPYEKSRFFYRSMSAATKLARARAESRFDWLRDIVTYFESYFDLPPVNLPKLDAPTDFQMISEDHLEAAAAECRRYWSLHGGPAPNLVRLLEKNGFIVSRFRLDADTLDAFSENESTCRPFIILGADKGSSVRSRSDAIHEVAHCVLHTHVKQRSLLSTKEHALLERQAYHFASAFLMPADDFSRDLVAPTLDGFLALKEKWGVSVAAMIKRCSQLKLMTEQQEERLWINLGRRGWRRQEPWDDKLPVEQPKLLRQCFEMMINSGYKSRSQLVQEIGLNPRDIEALANLPTGYLDEGFGEVITLNFKNEERTSLNTGSAQIIEFKAP